MSYSLSAQYDLRRQLTERVKQTGEVFTPRHLVRDMLDRLDPSVWQDPNKRWLEPSAGDGNFLVEIKHRLMHAGHTEIQILDNMLFSVELIDDNHWFLQHRLGYLIDGRPNPALNQDHFRIHNINTTIQDPNHKNPYEGLAFQSRTLTRLEVLAHRSHVCWSALDPEGFAGINGENLMDFGRSSSELAKLDKTKKIVKVAKPFNWDIVNTDALWPSDLPVAKVIAPLDSKIETAVKKLVEASKTARTIEARVKFVEARMKTITKLDSALKAHIRELVTSPRDGYIC